MKIVDKEYFENRKKLFDKIFEKQLINNKSLKLYYYISKNPQSYRDLDLNIVENNMNGILNLFNDKIYLRQFNDNSIFPVFKNLE